MRSYESKKYEWKDEISPVFEKLFLGHGIPCKKVQIGSTFAKLSLPEEVLAYLEWMGNPVRLHETQYGSCYTYLYSVDQIVQEMKENKECMEHGLLVIGSGLNGDLLTVNRGNARVGYVFHDDLWEGNYETLDDIYVEIPYGIIEFLQNALDREDYPFDGTRAEGSNGSI